MKEDIITLEEQIVRLCSDASHSMPVLPPERWSWEEEQEEQEEQEVAA